MGSVMKHGQQQPAGWYPAPHADNQPQYWDGQAWAEPDVLVEPEASKPGFFSKPASRKTATITLGVGVVVGLLLGAAGCAGNASQVSELKAQVLLLEDKEAEAATLADDIAELQTEFADLKSEHLKTTTAMTALDGVVAEQEALLAANVTDLATRDARIVELEATVAAAPRAAAPRAPAAPPAAAPPAANVYYKNCTEARAAGAAPISRGQAGYGTHLDRDGDGIGCDR